MQLEIINDVMKSMKVDMSLNEILKNLIDKLRELTHCDRLSLLLLRNEDLIITNVYPENSARIKIDSVIPTEYSLYWSALKNKQTIFKKINDPHEVFYEKEYLCAVGIQSVLVLPIF